MVLQRNLLRCLRSPIPAGTSPCKLLPVTSRVSKVFKDAISVGSVPVVKPPLMRIYFRTESFPTSLGIDPVKEEP